MSKGRFGVHGGQYMPETLMNAVIELEEAYNHYKNDPEFNAELTELLNNYAGRPSRLYFAEHMTNDLGGAKIYLKREDLNHTGTHKINNVLGQALLAKKDGQDPSDRRDRRRSARCCDRDRRRSHGMECVPHVKAYVKSMKDAVRSAKLNKNEGETVVSPSFHIDYGVIFCVDCSCYRRAG